MDRTESPKKNLNLKSFTCIFLFLIAPFFSFGQTNTFEWGEGLTTNIGKFDTSKYSLNEIETIYNYLHTPSSQMFTVGTIWKIEQMDTATTAPIEHYYQKSMRVLESMKIPSGLFWDSLLQLRKREIYEVCEDNKLFVLAIHNPSILYENYQTKCAEEIIALNGDSLQLLQAWYKLKERQKLNNCCPDKLEKEYQFKFRSKDKLKYARLELMQYGWGNCMNQFVYHPTDYLRIEQEFQKLFVSVIQEDED